MIDLRCLNPLWTIIVASCMIAIRGVYSAENMTAHFYPNTWHITRKWQKNSYDFGQKLIKTPGPRSRTSPKLRPDLDSPYLKPITTSEFDHIDRFLVVSPISRRDNCRSSSTKWQQTYKHIAIILCSRFEMVFSVCSLYVSVLYLT